MSHRALQLALTLTLAVAASACTKPTDRVRVDFVIKDHGVCEFEGQTVPCREAGPIAVTRHPGQAISAVVLANDRSTATLLGSFEEAHITHVQFGLIPLPASAAK